MYTYTTIFGFFFFLPSFFSFSLFSFLTSSVLPSNMILSYAHLEHTSLAENFLDLIIFSRQIIKASNKRNIHVKSTCARIVSYNILHYLYRLVVGIAFYEVKFYTHISNIRIPSIDIRKLQLVSGNLYSEQFYRAKIAKRRQRFGIKRRFYE